MITLDGIEKKLSSFTLGPISLTIDSKKIYCLKGESGSGKSTLLKLINLQQKQSAGTVTSNNHICYGDGLLLYRSENILLNQLPQADYEDTILDYIKFPFNFAIHKSKELNLDQVKNIFTKINLNLELNKKFRLLSSGEKQRIQLVRGLILNPNIIILDEAFNAIDPKNLTLIWNYLLGLNKNDHLGIIYSSHNPTEGGFGEIIIELHKGKMKKGPVS
jgi:ABC-type multidrug transport system ATPase subunit